MFAGGFSPFTGLTKWTVLDMVLLNLVRSLVRSFSPSQTLAIF
jgi:hypothetical protein